MNPAETLAVLGALGGIPPFRYKGRKAKVPDHAREAAAQAKRARRAWLWAKACAATEEGREWSAVRVGQRSAYEYGVVMPSADWRGWTEIPCWDYAEVTARRWGIDGVWTTWQRRILTRRSRDPIGRTWGHSRSQMLRRLRSLSRRLRKLPRLEMRACLRATASHLRGEP